MSRNTGDPSLVCETCNKIVRPIDKSGEGFLTCPFCRGSMEREVDRYNQRYNLKRIFRSAEEEEEDPNERFNQWLGEDQ